MDGPQEPSLTRPVNGQHSGGGLCGKAVRAVFRPPFGSRRIGHRAGRTPSAYQRELEHIRVSSGCDRIEFFSLEDAFGGINFDHMREELISRYSEPVSVVRERVITDPEARRIFNGVHRFLLEDQAMLQPDASRNSLRQQCKDRAYELVRRSNAWSRLVSETFPDAVRLSIHPQPCHSEKIGFHLIRTANNWLTPWHGVAVEVADGVVLVKRWEAEKLRASLVRRHGRPSHFVAPHVQLKECS
ncbi:MAG: L-tyrosine/L-tryptophan isonitrile synthase family protein [Pseudonocardiaceae bacterium]